MTPSVVTDASACCSRRKISALRTAATVHGGTIAFYWAAGFFAVGLLVAAFVLPGRDHLAPVR
jgi:hypothetical protein